jgi:hypothetical protein
MGRHGGGAKVDGIKKKVTRGKHRSGEEVGKITTSGKHRKPEEYSAKHAKPAPVPAASKGPTAKKAAKPKASSAEVKTNASVRRKAARSAAKAQSSGGSALPKGVTPRSKTAAK